MLTRMTTLALPRKMRCSPTVKVDCLKPFLVRAGTPAPGPVSDGGLGQEGEHEVELLLSRRVVRGVTRYLVSWRGHTSADDEWLRLEELAHCQEKVVEDDLLLRRGPSQPRRPPPWGRRRARACSSHSAARAATTRGACRVSARDRDSVRGRDRPAWLIMFAPRCRFARPGSPGREENYYNGECARDYCLDRSHELDSVNPAAGRVRGLTGSTPGTRKAQST